MYHPSDPCDDQVPWVSGILWMITFIPEGSGQRSLVIKISVDTVVGRQLRMKAGS